MLQTTFKILVGGCLLGLLAGCVSEPRACEAACAGGTCVDECVDTELRQLTAGTTLALGLEHNCALLDTGTVRCWGQNTYGQLGYGNTNHIGDNESPSTAGDVNVGGTEIQVVAGAAHTCALLDTGAVRGWGRNNYGQLGYGNTNTIGDNDLAGAGCSVTGAEGNRAAESDLARTETAAADVCAELVVAETALQRAPGRWPVAALGGSQYLVVWEDYRSGGSTLYAGRVGLDGAALDCAGIPLLDVEEASYFSSLYEPAVAFDGTNFLVVTLVNKQLHGIRVSGAGEVLDPGGFPIFTAESLAVSGPAVVFDGRHFVVAWSRGGAATDPNKGIYSARVKPDGTVVDSDGVRAYPMAIDSTRVAISFDGTNHLLSWVDTDPADGNHGVFAARIDADGQPLDQAGFRVSPSGASVARASSPVAGFDGTNHVILWQNFFDRGDGFTTIFVMVSRVGTGGQIRDPQGIEVYNERIESTDIHRLDITAGGGRSIVTWSMDHGGASAADIQVAQIAADGTISPHPANKLARGLDATLVPHPTGALMLWREGATVGARYPQLTGTLLDAAGAPVAGSEVVPARTASMQNVRGVATDGETFFVVWADTRDVASEGKGLYGARISRDGVPLDGEGILLTTGRADVADVVFDGANFVVIWIEHTSGEGDGSPFQFVRVTPAGEVLELPFQPELIASPDYTMAAASDGTHTLLVGQDVTRPNTALDAVLVDQQGAAASQTVNIVHRDQTFAADSPAVSFDGSGYLVVWNDGQSVFGQRIDADGALVGGHITIVSERGIFQTTTAFGGGNHLVLWQEAEGIFVKRVTPEGQVLDAEGKLITQVEPGCTGFGDCCVEPDVIASPCPSLAFDGTNFILAWRAPTVAGDATSLDVLGAEITPDGDVLSTFPISEEPEAEGVPYLAVHAGKQVLAAYARFVPGAPFDTRQARARLLGPIPEPEPGVDAGPTDPTPDAGPVDHAPDAGGNPVDPPPDDVGGCGGCTAGDSQPAPVASLLLVGIVFGLGLMRRRSAR